MAGVSGRFFFSLLLLFFWWGDSGVGGRITVEKRGSNRVVLEGLWDLCFRAM